MWLGGNQLLVDHRADIHILRQRDIIYILDLGDRLEYPLPLGGQTSQNVGTGVVGQGDKCLCILDPFLHKQFRVASVAIDDQHIARYDLCYAVALLLVRFQDLDTYIVRQILARADSNTAPPHDKDLLYFRIFLAGMYLYIFDMLFRRGEEYDIAG